MSIIRPRLLLTIKYFAGITSTQHAFYADKRTGDAPDEKKSAQMNPIASRIMKYNQELMAIWPNISRDIINAVGDLNLPDVTERLTRVLEYNALGGKNLRAMVLLYSYEKMAPAERRRTIQEDDYLARVLAWCIEILQSSFLILDDIEDQSSIRRNKLCWYRHKDVGLAAINDAVFIESAVYHLIRKYFKGRNCYIDIFDTFQEITLKTWAGQCLEFTNFRNNLNLDRFTMDRYDGIAIYKTAYFTFLLPVMMAMHLLGIKDQKLFRQMTPILLKIGHLYQVQDDYLSYYGNFKVLGKFGTDVEEGKCTWLIVTALQCATPEQRNILTECYGSNDPEKIERVKQLYDDLDILGKYFTYEREAYDLLSTDIHRMTGDLPRELFLNILHTVYHRKK